MDTLFTYTTVVYIALFVSLGIMLLVAHIPKNKHMSAYRTSRKVFACAYLLLGLTGILDFLFRAAAGEQNYKTIYGIVSVSLIHAWLNTYGYLLLQEPSQRNRRHFLRYGVLGLPLILFAGWTMVYVPSAHRWAAIVLGVIYAGQIVWTIRVCRKEYRANVRAMENYYDGTLRFSWMNGVLNITLVLALLNLISFYVPELRLAVRILTTLFYVYFAIRILDYINVFAYVGEARKEENLTQNIETEAKQCVVANGSGYSVKLASSIAQWCEAKHFCKDSLTIKDVATEMNTNHTYLSAYLNKQLGCSFQEWLNHLRIEEAKTLLEKYPRKSVEEIGRMVGISESYNFSRCFKKVTGLSPSEFKRNRE